MSEFTEFTAGIFVGIVGTGVITILAAILIFKWSIRQDADGEEKEEWTDTPGVIRFSESKE